MWIVRLALRRPYTFVVMAMLIAIMGVLEILTMPTDIFPNINIPVVAVVWQFQGMAPSEMEGRIVGPYERILTTTVNDIEHIESQSLYGTGVVKIYFQKTARIEMAMSQITAISQTATRQTPPGTQPPLIIQYSASSVPIVQLAVTSDTLPESKLFDQAFNFMRPQLVTIPGIMIPYPYGGKQRGVMVDLDPQKLYGYGISPSNISDAINAQNIIVPAGTSKIGKQEYQVVLNSSPAAVDAINAMPIKSVNGQAIYIRDVANVRDGYAVQTNVVHVNGQRGVLISILKNGNASTLAVVDGIKALLPRIRATMPAGMHVELLFDQSIFVRSSVEGVVKEACIAAGLTGLMILLFLGSWRSTLIVMISIPLSILVAIIILGFLGETLNVMTLGGMALAVGILVDDATVEIENIHRNLHMGKRLVQAILDGAQQIAVPAFVSTLCICIVFVPVVFISGAAKYLFTPLAMAVVFAMMFSYLLSRTLVPTMVHFLLAAEVEMYGGKIDESDPHAMHALHKKEAIEHHQPIAEEDKDVFDYLAAFFKHPATWIVVGVLYIAFGVTLFLATKDAGFAKSLTDMSHGVGTVNGVLIGHATILLEIMLGVIAFAIFCYLVTVTNFIWWSHGIFNTQFERVQRFYGGFLMFAVDHAKTTFFGFVIVVIGSMFLLPHLGQDFFPTVDAGLVRLHVRTPPGSRLEESADRYAEVTRIIRDVIPKKDINVIIDNIGIPNSALNLAMSDGSQMSSADGEISVALNEGHAPTDDYIRELRKRLKKETPDLVTYFAPADIVTQVLNFGLSAPIDVQVTGPVTMRDQNEKIAYALRRDLNSIPGVVDVHLGQVPRSPDLRVNVDRTLASMIGVSQRDVASDLLVSLSSSNQTAPNYWLEPGTSINYNIYVQTPQYEVKSINDLDNTPVIPTAGANSPQNAQLLVNLASTDRNFSATNISHYNIKPVFDLQMSVQGTDLGSVSDEINKVIAGYKSQLPKGSDIIVRGQIDSMNSSFLGLGLGLVFAVTLVYLLMVINFQSWLDPAIILMALPGAASGIMWMFWATQTHLSVPGLMGAIMSIGVATANSILMITFANDKRKEGMNAHDAAMAAGLTRLRPVMMTAAAMIIGMLPMSLGLGDGGEQNAPLGRAVIGGLGFATFFTLIFVPVVYSLLRKKALETHVEKELMDE